MENDIPLYGQLDDDLFETTSVVSGTECTGLVQDAIPEEYQADSYTDIYDVPIEPIGDMPPKNADRKATE